MEDPQAARGKVLIDLDPQLVVDEHEPVAPLMFLEDPGVREGLELLREILLLGPQCGREEVEIEVPADRAGVGERPSVVRAEGLDRRDGPRRWLGWGLDLGPGHTDTMVGLRS